MLRTLMMLFGLTGFLSPWIAVDLPPAPAGSLEAVWAAEGPDFDPAGAPPPPETVNPPGDAAAGDPALLSVWAAEGPDADPNGEPLAEVGIGLTAAERHPASPPIQ